MNTLISQSVNGEVVKTGRMDEESSRWWAKRNCRRCHGRGTLRYCSPNGVETLSVCSCVVNRMERAGNTPPAPPPKE